MLIISVEIMKIIHEREKCDTKCFVMRWSNSEVQLRQQKKAIISVTDNENDTWKRNAKPPPPKKKQQQQQ